MILSQKHHYAKRTLVPVEKHCTHELIYDFLKIFLYIFSHCSVAPQQRNGPIAGTTARLVLPQIPPGHLTPLKQGPPFRSTAPAPCSWLKFPSHPIPFLLYNRRCPVPTWQLFSSSGCNTLIPSGIAGAKKSIRAGLIKKGE